MSVGYLVGIVVEVRYWFCVEVVMGGVAYLGTSVMKSESSLSLFHVLDVRGILLVRFVYLSASSSFSCLLQTLSTSSVLRNFGVIWK